MRVRRLLRLEVIQNVEALLLPIRSEEAEGGDHGEEQRCLGSSAHFAAGEFQGLAVLALVEQVVQLFGHVGRVLHHNLTFVALVRVTRR